MNALEHHQSTLEVRNSMWSSMPTPNQQVNAGNSTANWAKWQKMRNEKMAIPQLPEWRWSSFFSSYLPLKPSSQKKNASSPLVWLPSYRIPSENPPALVSSPKLPPQAPLQSSRILFSLTACPARRTLLCLIFPQVSNSHLLLNSTTWFSDHQPRGDTWLLESPPPGKTTAENAWKWAPKLGSTPWFTKTNFRIKY